MNDLIKIFDLPFNLPSQWIKGCYSDHPLQSIEYIQKWLDRWPHRGTKDIITCDVIPQIIHLLQNNNYKFGILCCGYIRQLSLHCQIPQEIINFINKLCVRDYFINDKVQINGRWILCIISGGTSEQTKYIIDNGTIPILMDGIKPETSISVKISSIQTLGNIAGDVNMREYRNLLLSYNIVSELLPYCKQHSFNSTKKELSLQRILAWTLSNLCREKPTPETKYIKLILKAFSILIFNDDSEILQDVCWGYNYISDATTSHNTDYIVQSNILPRLIQLLEHKNANVVHPALRTIGNILCWNTHMPVVIADGILKRLNNLMTHGEKPIERDACWALSNITAGSESDIEAVISGNLCKRLIDILNNECYTVAKEALWAVSNAISGGNYKQISFLVSEGVIQSLFQFGKRMNDIMSVKIIMVMLEAVENILRGCRITYGGNIYAKYVMEVDGVNFLKQLQSKLSKQADKIEESVEYSCTQSKQNVVNTVYEKVNGILEKYFNET